MSRNPSISNLFIYTHNYNENKKTIALTHFVNDYSNVEAIFKVFILRNNL